MTPSWYDLLAVDRDASSDEIRAAWRDAVADLDPTDRRFAVLNRAAKVLLDPERRAAYDAELSDEADEEEPEDGVADAPGTAAPPSATGVDLTKPDPPTAADPEPAGEPEPATAVPTGKTTTAEPARASLLVTVLAGVLSVAFVVIAVLAWTGSRDEDRIEDGISEARSAAETAVVPILSYDATDLEAGRSTATSYLTDDFAEQYDELFAGLIEGSAAEIGARVETTFVSSAVVRSTTDGERVQVLVFFDQSVTNDLQAQPRVNSNQATLTMEQVGDQWLVDDIDTGAGG